MVAALCVGVCAIAAMVILGTLLDSQTLAALGHYNIPMSPLGTILVLLLSGALLLEESQPKSLRRRRLAVVVAVGIILLCLGFVVGHALGVVVPFRRWPALGRPTSLLTILAVLVSALSALTRWLSPTPRWRMRQGAALLAQVPLVLGTVVLISYAAGAPALYDSGFTPMSLPSALCALGLGLALMLATGLDTWPMAGFGLMPEKARWAESCWFALGPLALFLGLGVLIFTSGSFVMRGQIKSTRARVQEELATIADFKTNQIGDWLAERRAIANRISQGDLIKEALDRFLADPSQPTLEPKLRSWMENLQKGNYHRVVLFDARGRTRISVPPMVAG